MMIACSFKKNFFRIFTAQFLHRKRLTNRFTYTRVSHALLSPYIGVCLGPTRQLCTDNCIDRCHSALVRPVVRSVVSVRPSVSTPLSFEPSDIWSRFSHASWSSVLFCSSAVLDPTAGHTADVLSPFIPVLCHSD